MSEFRTGQRVKFRRSHDKSTELIGKIIEIDAETGNALIETEVDGQNIQISRVESAHLRDVTALAEAPVAARGEKGERGLRGLRGKQGEPGEE
jgi:hypothetical protein